MKFPRKSLKKAFKTASGRQTYTIMPESGKDSNTFVGKSCCPRKPIVGAQPVAPQ
jgi:hypothetical protein